ncbi:MULTISPECIES: RecB-like helicase [unclassified Campylobacter]|uniref:RecB-like helicase n=1 Tax=unclassified Campylobacter TaxID=2593542 RepID=UPI001237CA6F|nr:MULTISPECIES: RecB-like helicase [unclassified Campylobacter]KAA6224606.1 RecB-like helicase [Campylobacter sp. LR185c]KAA6224848.1 RecB-like helicase [Campylobacter sp. LR286c]KAA6227995.1 RecB-like helicase [Campylobacter sp. LR196d]KAA6233476.1 RecB-like helicase [Campylobacter sp. LR291e]KAA6234413.1 RecB-like helicase [Campylobacter sp. LR264d]
MSEFKPYLALEASAGSGKTFALSVRFVALILMGVKMNEILALTFTNKAAAQMKERIVNTFLNIEKDEKSAECAVLCELLNKYKAQLVAIRDSLKEDFLRQNLHISTLDSFFSRLVRVFALNLGLMSDFDIVSEGSFDKNIFINSLDDENLDSLAHYLIQTEDKNDKFFEFLNMLYNNAFVEEIKELSFPNKDALQEKYLELRKFINDRYLNVKGYKNLTDQFQNENLNIKEFFTKAFIKNSTQYMEKCMQDSEFKAKREEFIEFANNYALNLREFKKAKLLKLLQFYTYAKDKYFKANNILSFADIAKKAFELIQGEYKDMIYFRLDGRISHLLIDEFQDTSVIQYQIIKPIIAELVSGQGVKDFRSFFYVGDKKQSIYRFRGGKKELFDLVCNQFSQIQKENLKINYRSAKNIIDFVNEHFKNKYEFYIPQELSSNAKEGFLEVVELSKEVEFKQKSFEMILQKVNFLQINGILLNDICVLCWKNDDANSICEFLKENNIQAFTQGDIKLINKANVKILVEYAKYCIFGDEFYLHFLNEMLGFKPKKLRLDLAKSTIQTLFYLIKNLRLRLDLALVQFIEYARKKENILKLLFEPCEETLKGEHNFGVNVMNVHKSKGLEFDNVILLDALSGNKPDDTSLMLEYDINQGWCLEMSDDIRKNTNEINYKNFKDKRDKENLEEDINKLYVALTRARDSLIIIKNNTNNSVFSDFKPIKKGVIEAKNINLQTSTLKTDSLKPFARVGPQNEESNKEINSKEIYFGNAFHFFMQNVEFNGLNYEKICFKTRQKMRNLLQDDDFKRLFKRVSLLLKNDNFQNLIKDKKIFKEQTLSFNNEILRLDLLCVNEKETIIVDYKTGLTYKEEHKIQVSGYKDAIKEILQLPTRAFIVYILDNEININEI